jgi:hypothetical protein
MEFKVVKFYLDTNAIYNLGKVPSQLVSKSLISCLGIFELISGIKDERSFQRRRSTIRKIIDSEIEVVWELPKTIIEREFSYPIDYSDVDATKKMMNAISHHENYIELEAIKFIVENKEYSISTFNDYDHWFSDTTTNLFNSTKSDEKVAPEELGALIHLTSSLIIERFISDRGVEFQRPSDKYFEVLTKYIENQKLDKYIMFLSSYSVEKLRLGKVSGKNDCFDIGHVAYMYDVDHFVSNDKIYNETLSKYAGINTLSLEEYLEKA